MKDNKMEDVGFVDWNKKSLDEFADYLDQKYRFNSSGKGKAIGELIRFYREHKYDKDSNENDKYRSMDGGY